MLDRSMKLLDEKLKEYELPSLYSKDDRITKEYKHERLDHVLLQLLDKQFGYYTFVKKIYKDLMPQDQNLVKSSQRKKIQAPVYTPLAETVVVDGDMSI